MPTRTMTTSKYRLAEHQRFASAMMDDSPSLAIWYETGTGKTIIPEDWAYRQMLLGRLTSLLIVCPASLVGTWEASFDKMLMFEGYTAENVQKLKNLVTIRSFQKLYKTEKVQVKHRNGQIGEIKKTHLRPDVDRRWDAVVIDEAHCIGNHSSTQTKTCLTLGKLADRRYILTGTPVSGGGGAEDFQKLYGQLKFLDDSVWRSWTDFRERYVLSVDPWGNPSRYRAEDLRSLMKDYGIVARLADCYDMPEYTESEIPCELIEKQAYRDFQSGKLAPYGLTIENSGLVYMKLLQLCSGCVKTDNGPLSFKTTKDDVLRSIIQGTDDKVVVFCWYTASVDRVAEILRKFGPTVTFDGRSKGETWRELQSGQARYLVAQYQSGGVGIDLFASATMVLWEPCTSALLLEQTRARIYRKGQTRHCQYIYLYTPGTIEKKVLDTVRSGVEVTRDLLDKWSKELY